MNITLTRVDGGLHVFPAPPYIIKYLRYSHRSIELVRWKKQSVFEERLLHQTDGKGGVYTLQGFFTQLCYLIGKNKDTYSIVDKRSPMPEINWQAVKDVGPRSYQVDTVVEGLLAGMKSSGIWHATGGYGKTWCQAFTYAGWDKLNTILAIPLAQVFRQTYDKFVEIFPHKHIGRIGDGYNDISKDITISTFRSLKKCAVEKCELLLVDELQGAAGEQIQDVITSMKPKRIFGYTATDEGMFSGTDKLIKGIFGERLIFIPYDEAQEVGAVVPALVYFIRVPDIIMTASTIEAAISQGVKNCKPRNQLIAKVCASVPKNWATLVFVDHIQDHLVKLHEYMPVGTKYIHRETSKRKIGNFALTAKQQDQIIDEFTNNKFQYLIATDAFRAGVDIPHLRVVVQASSGSSKIEVIQEALRGSRTLGPTRQAELGVEDKTHFVLIDFLDEHDPRLHNMARARQKMYEEQKWEVRIVDKVEDIDWYNYENKL